MTDRLTIPAAIDTAVRAMLTERGLRSSSAAVARLVGDAPHLWHVYVTGKSHPGAPKIQAWLEALDSSGYALVLTWDATGGVVARMELPQEALHARRLIDALSRLDAGDTNEADNAIREAMDYLWSEMTTEERDAANTQAAEEGLE